MADNYLEAEKLKHREESIRLTVLQIESEWEVKKAVDEEHEILSQMNSLYEERRVLIENKQCDLFFSPLDYKLFCLQQKLEKINQEKSYLIECDQHLLNRISEEERAENELSKIIAQCSNNNHQAVNNFEEKLTDLLEFLKHCAGLS